MPEGSDIAGLLASLGESYAGRGVELAERGGKLHFQTAPDLGLILRREREESRRLSRAARETLAINPYRRPVTRAHIEEITGAALYTSTVEMLITGRGGEEKHREEGND